MATIMELIEAKRYEDVIGLPESAFAGNDMFLRMSAFLALGKTKEALDYLIAHRETLFALNPLMTLKANFEMRFALKQYDDAEKDVEVFASYPYSGQRVEEELRALPSIIAANRLAEKGSKGMDVDEALEILSTSQDDLVVLSALGALRKAGDLEEYRGLVEEILVGPYHDDVKTYALMLLSAKGSNVETRLLKRGREYTLVPGKLGMPYEMPEYGYIKGELGKYRDVALGEVCLKLLDLYALILYPERFVAPGEEKPFLTGLTSLGKKYLGQTEDALDEKEKEIRDLIEKTIDENPPLLR